MSEYIDATWPERPVREVLPEIDAALGPILSALRSRSGPWLGQHAQALAACKYFLAGQLTEHLQEVEDCLRDIVSKCKMCAGTGWWRLDAGTRCPVNWCQRARAVLGIRPYPDAP